MKFKLTFIFFGFFLIGASHFCGAGQLELINGDKVEGEIVRVDGEQLIWKSPNFGEITVKKSNIKTFSTDQGLKINGNREACLILSLENDTLSYRCGDNMEILGAPFLSLKVVEPYESFQQKHWVMHGKINFWGAYARGNEVNDQRSGQFETEFRRGEWRNLIGGDYSSSSWGGSVPQIRWSLHYSLDWFFRERWFWYNNIAEGEDQRRGLDNYTLIGTGAGYQFWENKKSALALSMGVAALNERYLPPNNMPSIDYQKGASFTALRTALDMRYTLPWGVSLFHRNELIHSMEDPSNWRIKASSGLSSMILSRIYAEYKWEYWFDNEPQPGRQAKDTSISLGVSYKW